MCGGGGRGRGGRSLSPLVTVSFYSIQSHSSNLIDAFYFYENNERTKKRVNCFLQDGANAGMRSLRTSIVIKLPNSMEWTLEYSG